MSPKQKITTNFVFRKHAVIGATAAEQDHKFLDECFIDNGDIDVLADCSNPKRIILGRTGSGKSSLLYKLAKCRENVIDLPPEALSLSYISNSGIIRYLEENGVKLDIFYTMLWKHVFTVELLKKKFNIKDEEAKNKFLQWLAPLFERNKKKEQALRYLETWGKNFWNETEYRIKEFTTTLEDTLKDSLGANLHGVQFETSSESKISTEERAEIINRAQRVVNEVQVKDLYEVINLLSDHVFHDPQEHYYIMIDRLDDNWVDDSIKYKLIRALFESIKTFQKVQNVKIIATIRTDLLHDVIERTRSQGFQEEKFHSMYLKVNWNERQIESILSSRVGKLIRDQYTKTRVDIHDILPDRYIDGVSPIKYIIDRTFLRPREAIQFFNDCLDKAEGKATISIKNIRDAEPEYSRTRLRSLGDEWHILCPNIYDSFKLLENKSVPFQYRSITDDEIDELLTLIASSGDQAGPLKSLVDGYTNGSKTKKEVLIELIRSYYRIGMKWTPKTGQ